MQMRSFRIDTLRALCALAGALPGLAPAASVEYVLVSLGSDLYRYEYTLHNDAASAPLQLIDLLFDPSSYEEASLANRSDAALASGWSLQFLASAPSIPAAFDIQATAAGLAPGDTLAGFAVEFRWLGAGLPGPQTFEIYDPVSFDLLQSGITTAVPEPSNLALVLAGVLLVAGRVAAARRLA